LARYATGGSIERTIVVTLAIHDGQQYRLKKITFTGNKQIATSQLRQQFEIEGGEIFDTDQIRQGLEQISYLYSRGYINLRTGT
jgi:outer membrane protein assembly factor BamA